MAPSGLGVSAARFAAGDQEVDLSWRDNSTNETSFVLERATSADFAGAETVVLPGANPGLEAASTDSGLLAATTYFYRVAAENAAGRSAFSNAVSVATQAAPAPTAPSFLADSPRALSDTSIQLRWEQNPAAGTTPVGETTGFRIERRLDGAEFMAIETQTRGACTDADPCTFTDTGLEPDTAYTYRVCALGVPGAMEQCSGAASATTDAEPPGEPNVTLTVLDTTTVRVEWTAPAAGGDVLGYRIDRREAAGDFAQVLAGDPCLETFSCDDTGLDPDTGYTYRVCALGEGGEACSAEATATTTVAPAAPVLAPITTWSDVELRLAWTAGAGGGTVTNYEIRRGLTPDDGAAVALPTLSPATFAFADTGRAASTTYHYRVCAIGADAALLGDANTACSNQVSAMTVAGGTALWTSASVPGTCSGCHGPINAPSGPVFANPASAQYLYTAVLTGPGTMPANRLKASVDEDESLQKARVRSICRVILGGTACDAVLTP